MLKMHYFTLSISKMSRHFFHDLITYR